MYALLDELGKYPLQQGTSGEGDNDKNSQKRLHAALPVVLGVNIDQLDTQWQQWITKKQQTDSLPAGTFKK
jgi:hypothetical protein